MHKQYGTSSEQSFSDQTNLFNEVEVTADLTALELTLTEVKSHYRKRTRLTTDKLPEELPVALLTPEKPFKERELLSRPVMDEFFYWMEHLNALPYTLLGKAAHYAHSQRKYLER